MSKYSKNYGTLLFYIGTVLIIFGGSLATFVPFTFYFYLLPAWVLLIGIILVWVSKGKFLSKIIWTISPIILFFGFQIIWYQWNKMDPEEFLIPATFKGKVHVIFNQDRGQPEEWDGDKRVYRIPQNGILLTQFKDEQGFIDQSYFFIDKYGNKTEIPQIDVQDFNEEWTIVKNINEPSRDSLGVFYAGRTYDDGSYEFYISSYRNLTEEYDFKYEQQFDTLEMNVIQNCK